MTTPKPLTKEELQYHFELTTEALAEAKMEAEEFYKRLNECHDWRIEAEQERDAALSLLRRARPYLGNEADIALPELRIEIDQALEEGS